MNGRRVILGGLDMNKEQMSGIKNMLLTGCGTSRHAAEFGAKIMRDLDCFDTVSGTSCALCRMSVSLFTPSHYSDDPFMSFMIDTTILIKHQSYPIWIASIPFQVRLVSLLTPLVTQMLSLLLPCRHVIFAF